MLRYLGGEFLWWMLLGGRGTAQLQLSSWNGASISFSSRQIECTACYIPKVVTVIQCTALRIRFKFDPGPGAPLFHFWKGEGGAPGLGSKLNRESHLAEKVFNRTIPT